MLESVRSRLESYAAIARTAMLQFLPQTDPTSDIQKYLYAPLGEYPRRQGKLVRACLCIAATCAQGGKLADAVNTAIAIELMHNATLVHDDFEDGAETRRNGRSLHLQYGPELAINAGDALFLLAFRPLLKNFDTLSTPVALKLLSELDWASWQTVGGQAVELGWGRDNRLDLQVSDYFSMVMKKTAWLGMILPLRAGALIASGGAANPDRFVNFGFYLGAVFQIANDIANFRSHPQPSDLHEGKRSLILTHVTKCATPDETRRIADILRKPRSERSAEEATEILNLVRQYESIEYARLSLEAMTEAATECFQSTFEHVGPGQDKDFIFGLIGYFGSLADVP